jgi:hypothetical protein
MIIDIYKTILKKNNMDTSNSTSKVAWNAAEGIIMEISNRRAMANTFFIQGNISKAFNTLISMKQSVVQSFEKDKREKLEEIESKFRKIASMLPLGAANSFNPNIREAHKLAKQIASKLYPEYNNLLMDYLQEKGYLVGEMSDASRMKF